MVRRRGREDEQIQDLLASRYYNDMHAARRRGRVWSVADLGELAARLGSPVTFDRRGDVVWHDDFEAGVHKWSWAGFGPGYGRGVMPCAHRSRNGRRSARLNSGREAGYETQQVEHVSHLPAITPLPRLGFEASFAYDAGVAYAGLYLQVYLGGGSAPFYRYRVRYDIPNSRLEYWTAAGEWDTLLEDVYGLRAPDFNTCKLVVDGQPSVGLASYTRILFNEHEILMDAYEPEAGTAASSASCWQAGLVMEGKPGLSASAWFDDVILTHNEPRN